ncbi:DUF4291 family protein [Microtetraspora fusca]|uniref:DUF4291 family protein n=1 Tax=Microtetraspora fusca TaxID=1997 RepID=A0ABW6V3B3_MICFU
MRENGSRRRRDGWQAAPHGAPVPDSCRLRRPHDRGRDLISTFTDDWIVGLADLTPNVRKAASLIQTGHAAKAQRLFPAERVYPLPRALEDRLCG